MPLPLIDELHRILGIKLPQIFAGTEQYPQAPGYDVRQGSGFLAEAAENYIAVLSGMPKESAADETAFKKNTEIILEIIQCNKTLIAKADEIDGILSTEIFGQRKALMMGFEVKKQSAELETLMLTFRESSTPNDPVKGVPLIQGAKSYLLACLYAQYLEMSEKTYVLDSHFQMAKVLGGTFTSEGFAKQVYKIDAEEKRQHAKAMYAAAQKEIAAFEKKQTEEQKKATIKVFGEQWPIVQQKKDSLDNIINELERCLTKFKIEEKVLKTQIEELRLKKAVLAFLSSKLKEIKQPKTGGKITDLPSYLAELIKKEKRFFTIKENHPKLWKTITCTILSVDLKNLSQSSLPSWAQKYPFEKVVEKIQVKVQQEESTLKIQLKGNITCFNQKHALITQLEKIKKELKGGWFRWIYTGSKVKKLNDLIQEIARKPHEKDYTEYAKMAEDILAKPQIPYRLRSAFFRCFWHDNSTPHPRNKLTRSGQAFNEWEKQPKRLTPSFSY